MGFLDLFGEPAWVNRLEAKLDQIVIQNENDKRRDLILMTEVAVQQEDLNSVASQLQDLVVKFNSLDLTKPLDPADLSGVVAGVSGLTDAFNNLSGSGTPDVPVPNPEPEPTDTETVDFPSE